MLNVHEEGPFFDACTWEAKARTGLRGPIGHDTVVGGAGNDTLVGTAGDDTLDGGFGADTMTGGLGNDTYLVDNFHDVVVEGLGGGVDTILSSVSDTTPANVEKLTLTGGASINAVGNALDNTLNGNAGNNLLNGGAGADTMVGGLGDDTYLVGNTGDQLIEAAGGGTDTVRSLITWTLGENLENLVLTGIANRNGNGNALDNILTGNSGNNWLRGMAGNDRLVANAGDDTLDGGVGADTLMGGLGNDSYMVNSAGDQVVEAVGSGNDAVSASITWALGANLENLTLTGAANTDGNGNSLDNSLTGNAGNNWLRGWAGNDSLVGNAGDDSLDGGAGNDKLVGGLGNDTYVVGSAGDLLIENAGEGTDTVQASISYTLAANVENLVLIGEADLSATGNSLDNRLDANAGNDTLDGGAGNDTLNGNLFGNDTLIAGSGNDDLRGDFGIGLFEMEGGGNDTVFGFNVDPFYFHFPHLYTQTLSVTDKLSSELSLSASDGDLILNFATGDEITVHNGLSEFTQFDEYIFGDKTQTLIQLIQTHGDIGLTTASDTVDFSDLPAGVSVQAGAGDDTVYGAVVGGNRLNGGDGNDRLHAGAAGNDTLAGGAGSDTLYGGAGTDTLQLTSVLGSDSVFDFSSGTDRVEISQRALPVGNGNTTLDGAATRAAPGGFATSAELVIFTSDISGAITTAGAAAHIGNATSAFAIGQSTLFVVDNGTDSALYCFKSAGNDAMVSVSELTLLATLSGTAHTDVPDYLLGA